GATVDGPLPDPSAMSSTDRWIARLGDPRTARAAAALATNELRVAYALHPVRLLVELRAPEAVPALITTLERRLRPHDPYRRVALACVDGLGALGDDRARRVLNEALAHPALAEAAVRALGRIPRRR
ncbi:adenylosuccinate lyase, partial [Streptomyces sp. NPDC007110]